VRKSLVTSYLEGLWNQTHGESYSKILCYFFPEFITTLVLYSVLYLLDAHFIADLKSTSQYATLGLSNNFLHFIIKIAEAMALSITVMCGQYNGTGDSKKVGQSFGDAFWLITFVGIFFTVFLYFGAYYIYSFLGVPSRMVAIGVPFLKVRAIGILFLFLYFACVAFLRSLKDTRTPMYVFVIGGFVFIVLDYLLIFGIGGFPKLGLLGSAWATVIQYFVMLVLLLSYILLSSERRRYSIKLFSKISDINHMKHILNLTWPIVLDKATVAAAYIWLSKMIAPMGKYAIASYTVVKDMERFAFLPAMAFAQIITILVSNDFGKRKWFDISANIKKVVFLTSLMVFALLAVLSLYPEVFIRFFDQRNLFTAFSSRAFSLLALFVFFDLLQLILSGALRGSGDVRSVMWVRIFVCFGFFCPLSYAVSLLPISDPVMKFVLIYAMFYIGNGIMSIAYIRRFRSGDWARRADEESHI